MITAWHCTNIYDLSVPPVMTGEDCVVTASTTPIFSVSVDQATTSVSTSTEILYGDWLALNLWIVFFLAVLSVGFFFQLFKRK